MCTVPREPRSTDKCAMVSLSSASINLLSASLTIPLVYCHINSFRRNIQWGRGHDQEAKRGSAGGPRITRNLKRLGRSPPICSHRGVPARVGGSERCNSSASAVDVCSDAPTGVQRAKRAADGGVVGVLRARSVSPTAPRINALRVARFDLYNARNCLPPKKLRREIQ